MDKARLGVLLISLFFIISIVASGLLYNVPEAPQQPQDGLSDLEPTKISMEARDIPATVTLFLPKLRIVAETKGSTSINVIDGSIYSIPGVRKVESYYLPLEQTELATGLIYIADIFLSNDLNSEQALSLIEEIPSLENIEGLSYALVELPQEIEFINPDLNISKTYSFRGNETDALVSLATMQGDEIKVSIAATFIGNDVLSVLAFETKNITATPLFGETSIEAGIASLEPKLLLDITTNYSQLPALEEVERQLLQMEGIVDFNLTKPFLEAKISLIADANISEQSAADLNSFLYTLSDDIIFYNQNFFRASLFFEEGTDLLPLKEIINEKLEELDLNVTVRETVGHATAEIPIESKDASVIPKIKSLLKSNGFEEFSLYQPGQISPTEISSEETGNTYSIDSALVEAFFSQPHSVGETIQLDVTYYIVREKIAAITAIEKE